MPRGRYVRTKEVKPAAKTIEAVIETAPPELKQGNTQPGVFEARRIGSYGLVFANFRTGTNFWVQFSKSTTRQEVVDVFQQHIEQYPWKLGEEVKIPGEEPTWKYHKPEGLQYSVHKTGKIHDIKSIERLKDAKKTKDTGRAHYDFFVITKTDERIPVIVGNGLFGSLKGSCHVKNVQDVTADAVRAIWPNRTINLDAILQDKDSVFNKLNLNPVSLPEVSSRDQAPENGNEVPGVTIAGVTSGKLDNPLTVKVPA